MRNWEEFGKDWRSVDSGILKWKVMGSVVEFQALWGESEMVFGRGREEVDAGILGVFGG